ncbi:triacylglycerol lipase [Emergencia sp. 1XD21-10]|uniref:esterase/lipase family protein n=1 Tax=Emergencia sp. 1XD21-10 TaxID=2304569 RepID=UPI00137A6EBB|nr:alpha/beta fold hydrolase [Emergencia sp. 1XD21-10]MCI9640946.1 triacylglycerol lipase [Emergencia sp.]NCE98635.1 triacylglycerol lipase [Emergencia sp. 1XD21-10]
MEELYYIIIFLPILAAIWFIIVPLGVPRRGKSEFESRIIRQMYCGTVQLRVFLWTSAACCLIGFSWILTAWPGWWTVIPIGLICAGIETLLFWCGMIRIYLTSTQLGMKWRLVAAFTGLIPVVNLLVLLKLINLVQREVETETEKAELNRVRAESEVCHTKYPLLLVHGVFFRDFKYLNYWGRIPRELQRNGAKIFYGKQQSADSVADCGEEIAARIEEICQKTGAEKVNIIGHSKGGLDSRYALAMCGAAPRIASLTTINTPHCGCKFAEWLFYHVPEKVRGKIAKTYNQTVKYLGDPNPDFLAAVIDLTESGCKALNEKMREPEQAAVQEYGIYCQSVASKMNRAGYGKFPLNLTYRFVKLFDGANDGLVSVESMKWGSRCIEIQAEGKRGVSHGDVIDLNRENIPGFDVREFYVELVKDLKAKGL